MKKLALLLLLVLLCTSGFARAEMSLCTGVAGVPEEIPHGRIRDIVLLDGQYYGRFGGQVLRMTPNGEAWRYAAFPIDISYTEPKLLTDKDRLLFFDGSRFHVIPTDGSMQISPIYENITLPSEIFYDLFLSDTEIIYCYLLEDTSSYGMQVERYNK